MFFTKPVILHRLRGPTIFVLSVFTVNLSFWIMRITVGSALHKDAGLFDERVMSSAYLVNTMFRREVNPAILRSSFAAARFDKAGDVTPPCGNPPLQVHRADKKNDVFHEYPINLKMFLTRSTEIDGKKSSRSRHRKYLLALWGETL